MRKFLKLNILVVLVLFFAACQKKEENKVEDVVKSVFAINPILKDENQNRVFNATASSSNQTKLSFKVQGNLNYFKSQIGDEVKKGDLIARLDSKPYELRVSQIEYALSEANASLQNAKSTYERTKKLYINQNSSVSDIDNARAVFWASSAKVKNITQELEYAKLQLSYTNLYAPINGYISAKYVNENENIALGTPIILISDKLVDEVRIQVPEVFINKIKKDSSVKVLFNSIDSKPFEAKISEISKYASQTEKTYLVIAKLQDSSSLIKAGMSADVYFDVEDKTKTIEYLVPSNSVLNDKNGYFVYVLKNQDGKYFVKRKDIKVANLIKEGFEITEGLDKNDLVLKAGMSEVFENMEVVIANIKELGN
ncbi:RND family efflux system, membrane fusion protein [Arcobacter acticola]|uniref:RND family efflux system, membrane fusion protein n=1 Tax=Arcobacter acticola TaxID=1849015 RepID=A0A6M8EMT8_9BACT|nr:efflux RND transporter periplasmic adaptor subunit [Arcobacter acticola]QKE29399.1 RND family efflux system, membrane fusion protein [Arcobacter acticola]